MSQCLYAYNNPNYDDVVGSGWQAAQVSTISIMNFSGRIFIGEILLLFFLSLYPLSNLSLHRLSFRHYEEQVRHATLVLFYIGRRHVFHFPSRNGHHQRHLPSMGCKCSTRPCLWKWFLPTSNSMSRVVWNA